MITTKWVNYKYYLDEVEISGHAGGEYGKDIVCSAVSSAIYGLLNSLTDLDSFKIEIKTGYFRIKVLHYPGEKNIRALGVLLTTLYTIQSEYPKKIKIDNTQCD